MKKIVPRLNCEFSVPEIHIRNLRAALIDRRRGSDAFVSGRELRRREARAAAKALRKARGAR